MERPEQVKVHVGGGMPPIWVGRNETVVGSQGILYQPEESTVEKSPDAANGSIDFNKTRAKRHPVGLERNDPYGAPDPRMTPFETLGK